MNWRFWDRPNKQIDKLTDIIDMLSDEVIELKKRQGKTKVKHLPFNDDEADKGRPWRYKKDGITKEFF